MMPIRELTASLTRATLEDEHGEVVAIVERSTLDPECFTIWPARAGRGASEPITRRGWFQALEVAAELAGAGRPAVAASSMLSAARSHDDQRRALRGGDR